MKSRGALRMNKEDPHNVSETEAKIAVRRPYASPKLTVFGDMKALTAGGSPPFEEGSDEAPNLLGSLD
jgi:hypothetical protein